MCANHAIIECDNRRVTLCPREGVLVRCIGDRTIPKSGMWEFGKLLSNLHAILSIVDGISETLKIENIPIVSDFSDVFPEDLWELPPHREIEMAIELMPGTIPIYMVSYRLAPAELKELKN